MCVGNITTNLVSLISSSPFPTYYPKGTSTSASSVFSCVAQEIEQEVGSGAVLLESDVG
jgi:hypothetical protein